MNVSRREIWLVNLDPTLGAEIRKTRPVVVVNSDSIGALPIRLVAPITEWKDYFLQNVWHVISSMGCTGKHIYRNGLKKELAGNREDALLEFPLCCSTKFPFEFCITEIE